MYVCMCIYIYIYKRERERERDSAYALFGNTYGDGRSFGCCIIAAAIVVTMFTCHLGQTGRSIK